MSLRYETALSTLTASYIFLLRRFLSVRSRALAYSSSSAPASGHQDGIESTRDFAPTSKPSIALPPEVLIDVFSWVGTHETNMQGWVASPHSSPFFRRGALTKAALVCKGWSSIATTMLYEHCCVISFTSLEIFWNTFSSSQTPFGIMKSFTFLPSPDDLDQTRKRFSIDEVLKMLRNIVDNCLNPATIVNLRLADSHLRHASIRDVIAIANLETLHVVNPSLSPLIFGGEVYPRVRNLTLELSGSSAIFVWPITPKLKCLRLIGGWHHYPWDKTPVPGWWRNLEQIELISTTFPDPSRTLIPLLRASADTLEHLTLMQVTAPALLDIIDDISFLQCLRVFCIGPKAFGDAKTAIYPKTLEELIILESRPTPGNRSGLERYLNDSSIPPALKIIRVLGVLMFWKAKSKAIEDNCKKLGIHFDLTTYVHKRLLPIYMSHIFTLTFFAGKSSSVLAAITGASGRRV